MTYNCITDFSPVTKISIGTDISTEILKKWILLSRVIVNSQLVSLIYDAYLIFLKFRSNLTLLLCLRDP